MGYEFDPEKNAANIAKHGLSLSEGDSVLYDPIALTVEDTSAQHEQRWETIGMNSFGELRVVVWTERGDNVRFISVRKPEPSERRDYEENH